MLIRSLIDVVFPSQCVFCGRKWSGDGYHFRSICVQCMKPYIQYSKILCPVCGAYIPDVDLFEDGTCLCCNQIPLKGVISLFPYKAGQPLREFVLALKHRGNTWVVPDLAYMLASKIRNIYIKDRWDGVVSVPLHYSRKWYRGFNQAELIGRHLAEYLKIPYFGWLLRRRKRTKHQSGGRVHRYENVKNAFLVDGICKHAKLILVDDVITTGATIRECAKMLYSAGANEVLAASCGWVVISKSRRERNLNGISETKI